MRTCTESAPKCSPGPAWGQKRRSLLLALIVLATGTFATGTDAFVIGGVLTAVA